MVVFRTDLNIESGREEKKTDARTKRPKSKRHTVLW